MTEQSGQGLNAVFLLGGQPYIYTEQDWGSYPAVAQDAYEETRAAYFLYWGAQLTGTPINENGRWLSTVEMRLRAMEFAGGLAALVPYIHTLRFFRPIVHVLVVAVVTARLHT